MPKLTPQQQYAIEQVAATMAIEDMPLTERAYKYLVQQVKKQQIRSRRKSKRSTQMDNTGLEAVFQKCIMISLKHCNYISDSIHSLRWMLSFFIC